MKLFIPVYRDPIMDMSRRRLSRHENTMYFFWRFDCFQKECVLHPQWASAQNKKKIQNKDRGLALSIPSTDFMGTSLTTNIQYYFPEPLYIMFYTAYTPRVYILTQFLNLRNYNFYCAIKQTMHPLMFACTSYV